MLNILARVKRTQDMLYSQCGLALKSFEQDNESADYYAHHFTVNQHKCLFRIAKATPKKQGFFVTIWKRNSDGVTAPYETSDLIDFVVVGVDAPEGMGTFIFPKSILEKKNIFSTHRKEGKRGIRVYAPWDKVLSKQASATQKWQQPFFIDFRIPDAEAMAKLNQVYGL